VRRKGKAALWAMKACWWQGSGSERSLRSGGIYERKSTLHWLWASPNKLVFFFPTLPSLGDLLETNPCSHLQEPNFTEENTFSKLKAFFIGYFPHNSSEIGDRI